jgi:AraC family transcriptional regulator
MNDQLSSEVSIETLEPMRVACYRAASLSPEEDGWKYILEWRRKQSGGAPGRRFGFDVDVTPEQQKDGLRGYEVWLTVPPQGVRPSAGVTICDFAGGLYAVQTLYKPFVDPFARIPQGWKELHEWVTGSSQYRCGEHQWMEEILPGTAGGGGDDLKLYHPIQLGG